MRMDTFITSYTSMDINGIPIHCPYWMNRLIAGKVTVRGFENGKGTAADIGKEIVRKMEQENIQLQDEQSIHKLAKRYRIGIDCSGLVYRYLDYIISTGAKRTSIKPMDRLFSGGINKTNAARLTSLEYCIPIMDLKAVQTGDMIRMMGGKHVAVVIYKKGNNIYYLHSSSKTEIKGVHIARFTIVDEAKSLVYQKWEETGEKGESFTELYLHSQGTNGIYRLKIFDIHG